MSLDFPSNWRVLPLEDCMSAIIDYRGKTPNKTISGVPLVTAKIVKNGRINYSEELEYVDAKEYDSWMNRGLPLPGDIVFTTEAPLAEVAQLDSRKVGLAQRIITLRGKSNFLDNTYLKFVLQSDFVRNGIFARATGTTVIGIKQSELRKVLLPVPPIEEQRAIARTLGALDDKIELNRQMNRTLEEIARTLFKSWFVDFDPVRALAAGQVPAGMDAATAALFPSSFVPSTLGKIPEGWQVDTIGNLTRVVGGGTPSTQNLEFWENGIINWATPKDLSNLQAPILLETERQITKQGLGQISSGLLPAGTVLLSSRAPIGYLALADTPVAINQGFIGMICDSVLPNYYVLNWTKVNTSEIMARANGTTFLEVSKSSFRPIPVLVPSEVILTKFVQYAEPIYSRIKNNLKQTQTLAAIRDALLPRLISGELRVPEALREVHAAVSNANETSQVQKSIL